jgi:hypothetical protein
MGSLFHRPRQQELPPPAQPLALLEPPEPTPPPATADVTGAGEAERKRLRRRRGRKETFLTGELVPVTGKKTVLG